MPQDAVSEEVREHAWREAAALYRHALSGELLYRLEPLEPWWKTIELAVDHRERILLTKSAVYARHCATCPDVPERSWFAVGSPGMVTAFAAGNLFGKWLARRRAERDAEARWRGFQSVPLALTQYSVIVHAFGQWQYFRVHPDLTTVEIDLLGDEWPTVALYSRGLAPVLLKGPWVPWLAVALVWLQHGIDGLQQRAELQPLAVA